MSYLPLSSFSAEQKSIFLETYKKDGIIIIPNFLEPQYAEILLDFYKYKIPSSWLRLFCNPSKKSDIPNIPENKETIVQEWNKVGNEINNPGVSYRFYKGSDNHVEKCDCMECELKSFFREKKVIDFIKSVTGEDISKPFHLFSSFYTSGCFLTLHTDIGRGKVAFVLNFTKNWSPIWGGCLHMMENDFKTVKKVITPQFNSLVLFHIPENGIPHYVSYVPGEVKEKRIAMSGWFN